MPARAGAQDQVSSPGRFGAVVDVLRARIALSSGNGGRHDDVCALAPVRADKRSDGAFCIGRHARRRSDGVGSDGAQGDTVARRLAITLPPRRTSIRTAALTFGQTR